MHLPCFKTLQACGQTRSSIPHLSPRWDLATPFERGAKPSALSIRPPKATIPTAMAFFDGHCMSNIFCAPALPRRREPTFSPMVKFNIFKKTTIYADGASNANGIKVCLFCMTLCDSLIRKFCLRCSIHLRVRIKNSKFCEFSKKVYIHVADEQMKGQRRTSVRTWRFCTVYDFQQRFPRIFASFDILTVVDEAITEPCSQ